MTTRMLMLDGIAMPTIERLNRARTIAIARYEEDGCFDRFGYLRDLARDHGVDLAALIQLADLLGADEDFDGLVTSVEDGLLPPTDRLA